MNSADLRNKMWVYASVMFMGALLVVTLTVLGLYIYKSSNGFGANKKVQVVTQKKQIKQEVIKVNTEVSKVNEEAASSLYTKGMNAFDKKDNKTAADSLSKSIGFDPSQPNADKAAYYAAVSYKALGDTQNEKKYLEKIIINYQNSTLVHKAMQRYNTMK